METVQDKAVLTAEQLLKAVGQLDAAALDDFVQQVILLRAQRRAPCLSRDESELLLEINQGLPDVVWRRYHILVTKRRAETLTPEEYEELLRLNEEVEAHNTRRVESLVKLSLQRQVTLDQLMKDLGLRWPEHA